jgi:hypothetical protein
MADARCVTHEGWRGNDKQLHALVGMSAGAAGTYVTGSAWTGFWIASGLALAKEALDASGMGQCSSHDAAITILGGALGAVAAGWHLRVTPRGTSLTYSTSF